MGADQPKEKKRVVIDESQLNSKNAEISIKEIEVPELNGLMGLDDGEVAIVKVRQLDLNEYMLCQQHSEDRMRNLVEGVLAAAEKRGEVEDEIMSAMKGLSPTVKYFVDLCSVGVIEPKLAKQHWVFMLKHYALVVEKIAGEIMMLTQGGATLKKNS